MSKPSICFLGGGRHSQPLATEDAKKYRELSRLAEIFVVGFSTDATPRRFEQDAHFYLLPKISPHVIRYALMFLIGPLIAGFLVFRRGVSIIVAQSPYEGVVAVWVKLVARLLGRRIAVVIESHGDFEATLFLQRNVRLAKFYRTLMRNTARFALNHADVLRAISSTTRAQLLAQAPGRPLIEFPTWTDIDVFLEAGANKPDQGIPVILYAGVLTPLKGVHRLVEAFTELAPAFDDAKLVIIGEAEDAEYGVSLRRSVAHGLASSRVEFVGRMFQAELAAHMARARVLVLPSASEGLGRVVFEAMACGTPVIGTTVGGIPDIIQDGANGFLFEPNDKDTLMRHLRWVLENPEGCLHMGQEARRFARDFFSIECYREGYAKVFQLASEELAIVNRARGAKQIVCLTLLFPGQNNVRTDQLVSRLGSLVRFCRLPLSRMRVVRAVQYRAWRWLKRWLIYPIVFRFLARRYALLLAFDPEQAAAWPRSDSVIVDTDDPRFTTSEIELLGRSQVRSIVVTTDEARETFRKLGVVKPIHVIPQGVDTDFLDRQRSLFVANSCKAEQEIVAGYLAPGLTLSCDGPGRWRGGQDDLDLLFRAFEAAHTIEPRLTLWLIGRTSSAVEKYARGKSWVRLFGYLPFAETWRYVANFNIGLYPRIQPPPIRFSFKVAQYMACGIPVISAFKDPLLEEVGCGVICISENEFVDALVNLTRSPEDRKKLGQSGARYAREKLSWPRLVREYEKILAA